MDMHELASLSFPLAALWVLSARLVSVRRRRLKSAACMERADGRSGRGATRPVLRVGDSRGSPALTDRAKSRPVAPAWSLRPRGFVLAGACLALCGGGQVLNIDLREGAAFSL